MASRGRAKERRRLLPGAVESGLRRLVLGTYGLGIVTVACAAWASLATWSVHDPSLNNATRAAPRNVLGNWGAVVADLAIQSLGLASIILFLPLAAWGWHLVFRTVPKRRRLRLLAWPAAVILLAAALAALPQPKSWPLPNGLGGIFGDFFMAGAHVIGPFLPDAAVSFVAGLAFLVVGTMLLLFACGTSTSRLIALWAPRSTAAGEWASASLGAAMHFVMHAGAKLKRIVRIFPRRQAQHDEDAEDFDEGEEETWEEPEPDADGRIEPSFGPAPIGAAGDYDEDEEEDITSPSYRITRLNAKDKAKKKHTGLRAPRMDTPYDPPPIRLLQQPRSPRGRGVSDEVLQENARELEGVLQDFGVKGEITNVRPGPVVTLYELEPAPGTKSHQQIQAGLLARFAKDLVLVFVGRPQEAEFGGGAQIEDLVANSDAEARIRALLVGEGPEGKVLDGKIAVLGVGRLHEGACTGIVGLVGIEVHSSRVRASEQARPAHGSPASRCRLAGVDVIVVQVRATRRWALRMSRSRSSRQTSSASRRPFPIGISAGSPICLLSADWG